MPAKKTTKAKATKKVPRPVRNIINVCLSDRAAKKVAKLAWGTRSSTISDIIEANL